MKNIISVIAIIVMICAIIGLGMWWSHYVVVTSYNEAISLTKEGKYEEAIEKLKTANPGNNFEKDIKSFVSYDIEPDSKYYKDSWTVYQFILTIQEYTGEKNIGQVKKYLDLIPESYSGDLSKEISDFIVAIKPELEEYEAEQKRREEELRLLAEESERQFYAKLKTKIPYEGMSEADIDYTIMGKHDKLIADDDNDDFVYNVYYWDANNGDTMLAVSCVNGKVHHVSKYYTWAYWTSDGKPNPNGTNNKSSSTKKNKKKEDPYNVYDYTDPEDFYYDNYDDFWEYEEAEDYFNEHHN